MKNLSRALINAIDQKVRLALRRGTQVEHAGREGLGTFAQLMKITGERDGF